MISICQPANAKSTILHKIYNNSEYESNRQIRTTVRHVKTQNDTMRANTTALKRHGFPNNT